MLKLGLKRSKLTGIVISHLHGDHYFGLFGLLSSMSMDGRHAELVVAGPSALEQMITMHLNQGGYALNYPIRFISTDEVEARETLYEKGNVRVDAFPLKHRVHCTGFVIQYERVIHHLIPEALDEWSVPVEAYKQISTGADYQHHDGTLVSNGALVNREHILKSYAYCSDTCYFEELPEFIKGVDVLYHEATFLDVKAQRARETFHSTASQAATVARQGEVGQLLIGHFSSRYDGVEEFLYEARQVFKNTEIAEYSKSYDVVGTLV